MSWRIVLTFCFTFALWTSVHAEIYTIHGDWNLDIHDPTDNTACGSKRSILNNTVTESLRHVVMSNTTAVTVHGDVVITKGSERQTWLSVLPLDNAEYDDGKTTFAYSTHLLEPGDESLEMQFAAVGIAFYVDRNGTFGLDSLGCIHPSPLHGLSIHLTDINIVI